MGYPKGNVTLRPEFGVAFQEFQAMPDQYGYVGMKVLKPLLVGRKAGDIMVRPLKEKLKTGLLNRKPDGSFNRIQRFWTTFSFATKTSGLESRLDEELIATFPDYDSAAAEAAQDLWDDVMRGIEESCIAAMTAGLTPTPVTETWSDHTNAKPVDDIINGKKTIFRQSGLIADTLVIGFEKLLDLTNSEQLTSRLKFYGGDNPDAQHLQTNLQTIARYFGLRNIHVAGLVHDEADYGQDEELATLWDPDIIGLFKSASGNSVKEACIGRTMVWPGMGSGVSGEDAQLAMDSYWEDQTESEVFRCKFHYEAKQFYAPAGLLLDGADAAVS